MRSWRCSRLEGVSLACCFLGSWQRFLLCGHMSYSLNSLKGVIWGCTIGVIKGDTRSLDNGLYDRSLHQRMSIFCGQRAYLLLTSVYLFARRLATNINAVFVIMRIPFRIVFVVRSSTLTNAAIDLVVAMFLTWDPYPKGSI